MSKFDWAKQWRMDMDMTDEEGEKALAALKKDMPSEAQTRYNQRDINKRRNKNEKLRIG
tara:strand:+ start:145 stop:321 length:177 start_codon:yes stop_codon:yes gene_type:complete